MRNKDAVGDDDLALKAAGSSMMTTLTRLPGDGDAMGLMGTGIFRPRNKVKEYFGTLHKMQ